MAKARKAAPNAKIKSGTKVEQVEKLALIARLPAHHDPPPRLPLVIVCHPSIRTEPSP